MGEFATVLDRTDVMEDKSPPLRMKRIPAQLAEAYLPALKRAGVATEHAREYLKWLRFYLDFCAKYEHAVRDPDSLQPFLQKLAAKRQSVAKQEQAAQSVALYYRLMEKWAAQDGPGAAPGDRKWEAAYRAMKDAIGVRQYSPKTLQTYRRWVEDFQRFVHDKSPDALTSEDVQQYLTHLAVKKRVVASTQNQALNAILFLFRHVLKKEMDLGDKVTRARRTRYIPVVLTRREVNKVVAGMADPYDLVTQMLYGCGLRLFEALKLRVHCFNFDDMVLTVHDGKGKKDRAVPIPRALDARLQARMDALRELHDDDLGAGYDGAFMPGALDGKWEAAARDFSWQWFFPAKTLTLVPDTGEKRRWHMHKTQYSQALRRAVQQAKLTKRVTAHTFRHSYASHLLRANYDIRTIQQLLGHSDVRTTMIYTHTVQSRTIKEVASPLDFVEEKEDEAEKTPPAP